MKIAEKLWTEEGGWVDVLKTEFPAPPQLVMMFGSRQLLEKGERFNEVRKMYPQSQILACSTAGDILDVHVRDNSMGVAAISLDRKSTRLNSSHSRASRMPSSA